MLVLVISYMIGFNSKIKRYTMYFQNHHYSTWQIPTENNNFNVVFIWRARFNRLYIHSYMLLIYSSGHSKEANFQHKIYCKNGNADTNWNCVYNISTIQIRKMIRTAFRPCHKIYTFIKKNKGIKSCLTPKPLLSIAACYYFLLLITLYTLWNKSNESNSQ